MVFVTEGASEGADAAALCDDGSCVLHSAYTKAYTYKAQVECVRIIDEDAYMSEVETVGTRLGALRERAGLTVREFAKAAGYSHGSGVQRYLEPTFAGPLGGKAAERIANALVGRGNPPITAEEIADLSRVTIVGNATPAAPMEGASAQRMVRDVPVYGTALGAEAIYDGEAIEQTMLNTGEVVQYAKRPTILNGRTDVYALYVQGQSMYPRYRDGAMIFVEQKRQPHIGDDCVLYLHQPDDSDGSRPSCVLVKTLARKSASYVELEQYQPTLTFRIDRERIGEMHRVIPWEELIS